MDNMCCMLHMVRVWSIGSKGSMEYIEKIDGIGITGSIFYMGCISRVDSMENW